MTSMNRFYTWHVCAELSHNEFSAETLLAQMFDAKKWYLNYKTDVSMLYVFVNPK